MFTACSAAVSIVHDRQVGYFRALLVSPVRRSTIGLARIVAGALVALAQGLLLLPFAPYVGVGFSAHVLLQFMSSMLLCAMVFSALGLVIAMPFRSVMVFPVISNALLLPMFFLSGGLYALDLVPPWVLMFARLNPAAYGVDLMRGILTGRYFFSPLISISVMIIFLMINSLFIAYFMSRETE